MKRFLISGLMISLALVSGMAGQVFAKGCGPGPVVMKATVGDQGAFRQVLGFSTNVTFLPIHTLAITFGTSGCSSSGLVKKELDRQIFVAVNRDPLLQDMSRGEGQFVDSMASLMGCPVMFYPAFGQMTQERLEAFVADANQEPAEFVVALRSEIYRTPALAACEPLG